MSDAAPLLKVDGLKVHFPVMQGVIFKRQDRKSTRLNSSHG